MLDSPSTQEMEIDTYTVTDLLQPDLISFLVQEGRVPAIVNLSDKGGIEQKNVDGTKRIEEGHMLVFIPRPAGEDNRIEILASAEEGKIIRSLVRTAMQNSNSNV